MARQISIEFANTFPDQDPEFHAAQGKGDELFLGQGPRPLESHLQVPEDELAHTVKLDLGELSGVDAQTVFSFYASVDDLGITAIAWR